MATRSTRSKGVGRSARSAGTSRAARTGTGSRTARGGRVGPRDRFEQQKTMWIGINAVLVLALVAAVAAAGWYGYQWYDGYRVREGHIQAQAAARQTVVDFLTISASSVDNDLKQVLEGATGEFKKQYEQGMSEVRTAVTENKVSSTGRVLRSGVVSGDPDSAVVLVAVDARIKNVRTPDGRKAHYRVQVDMVYDKDQERWLVSRLEFVG
ncbi:MAG: hypothetical protein ACRDT6_16520 [Micromonosporaceae bacterium]